LLEIADNGAGVRVSGFAQGDGGGVEDEVVHAGTRLVGCGGDTGGEGLFVEVEVSNDLFGKVRVLDFFAKLCVECHEELWVG
jgi:hypothetical protein